MKIKKTKDIVADNFHALIYGESGAGKTTLASTLENAVVISCESGLLSLKNCDVDYVEAKTIMEFSEHLEEASKSDYQAIFIDSLTEVAQMLLQVAVDKYPDDKQMLKRYGYYNEMAIKMIKKTRDLNKNVVYTALEKIDKNDVGKRFHIPDLPGSISSKAPQFFDFVFNLQVFEKDNKEIRALLTRKKDNYICKSRLPLDEYEKPHLGNIINKAFKGEL